MGRADCPQLATSRLPAAKDLPGAAVAHWAGDAPRRRSSRVEAAGSLIRGDMARRSIFDQDIEIDF
jgi:hypothetical protein